MNKNQQTACPACEYELNTTGRPVERNGQMECLDCGSKWRVYGTSHRQENTGTMSVVNERALVRLREPLISSEQTSYHQSLKPGSGIFISAVAVFALFACLLSGVLFLQFHTKPVVLNELNIAEVKIREQDNCNRRYRP